MPNIVKKVILSFLSFLIIFASVIPGINPVLAQDSGTNWYNQSFENWFVKVYDEDTSPSNEIFGERYTAAQVQWVVYSLASMPFVTGSELSRKAVTCALTSDLADCTDTVGEFIQSVLQTNSTRENVRVASVFDLNPISGVGYIKNLGKKFSLVSEVNAQGFGYTTGGRFFQNLWTVSRNISYGLVVLVVIILSFMIMFRVKISPQVVISVQSAIPKVIITIILITFSYAIAGLVIDLMYVVLGLISALIAQSGLTSLGATELFTEFALNNRILSILVAYWVLFLMGGFFALIKLSGGLLSIIAFVFAIVSILVLLWQTVKIFIMLVKAFVNIVLSIAIGPLQILTGAFLPNSGFVPWVRNLASQLLIFPLTAIMFFFAFYFLRQAFPDIFPDSFFAYNIKGGGIESLWTPPFLGNMTTGEGLFGGAQLLVLAISFVIVTSISKLNEIIQGAISGRPYAFGSAVGEAVQQPFGVYGNVAATQIGKGQLPWPLNNIGGLNTWWERARGNERSAVSTLISLLSKGR